ncbi:MAG: 50S ribosomal protein L35 [Candidatus Andersenbacteria bacterium]|nr:50S ribosomal protein L35 [Candidatus Andersenbacteria bacterium]MBI3250969.1 50S ribosomal protein L35 [Candidatus Andersenbacteria bacterium]
MPKQKTKRAAMKRFSVSSNGKVQHRAVHQAHFNAKATGNETRRKHPDQNVSSTDSRRIQDLLPYA